MRFILTGLILLAAAVTLTLVGCGKPGTTVKSLYQSNEQLIAGFAPQLTAPACAAAVQGLQPAEVAPVCSGLLGCAQSVCNFSQGFTPTPQPTVGPASGAPPG